MEKFEETKMAIEGVNQRRMVKRKWKNGKKWKNKGRRNGKLSVEQPDPHTGVNTSCSANFEL